MLGKYESMIVFAPLLTNEEIEVENKKILDLVLANGGEIVKTEIIGKKQLAYEIAKYREGYYIINYFNLDTQKTHEIDRHYRLNERLLRYNIIKLDTEE